MMYVVMFHQRKLNNLILDVTEVLGIVLPDTPVVLFFLDNSSFIEEESITQNIRSVERDDGFHVQGALVVAPDKAIKHALDQQKRVVEACGSHLVFIMAEVRQDHLLQRT